MFCIKKSDLVIKGALFSILFLQTFCKSKKIASKEFPNTNHEAKIAPPNSFRVYKIDSVNNLYIIYAYKGGAPFKIVSRKEQGSLNCEKIHVNNQYDLIISSIILKTFNGKDISPNRTPLLTGIEFYGTVISLEKDSIMDIYTSPNIKGLCYQKLFKL